MLKYIAIALALLVVMEIPAFSQNNDHGNHISFLSSPGLNFTINGVNTTLKFFTGGVVQVEDNEMNYSSSWNITKNGFMNYTYVSNAIESVPVSFGYTSFYSGTIYLSVVFYVNTTIYIHPVSLNRTYNSSNNISHLMSGKTNTLSITYNIVSHRIVEGNLSLVNFSKLDQQYITVPEVFYFGNSSAPDNLTFNSDHSNYNSFRFHFGNSPNNLFYTFNRTYSENGIQKEVGVRFENEPHRIRMGFVFPINSSYTNISYDPYVITPGISLSNFNVSGPLNGAINYIMDNSEILIGGFAAGLMIIGAGYISYRKKSHL